MKSLKLKPWRPSDVPLGCVVKYATMPDWAWQKITGVTAEGLWLVLGNDQLPTLCEVSFKTLRDHWLYSMDGKHWQKCGKQR